MKDHMTPQTIIAPNAPWPYAGMQVAKCTRSTQREDPEDPEDPGIDRSKYTDCQLIAIDLIKRRPRTSAQVAEFTGQSTSAASKMLVRLVLLGLATRVQTNVNAHTSQFVYSWSGV